MASTTALLQSLVDAVSSSTTAFPDQEQNLLPPADGISLLDVKNELLLSYLQNLVFLIILRLRQGSSDEQVNISAAKVRDDDVVKKLVELRVLMERGVRPLENKLRYQIEKVLRAAEDAKRSTGLKKSRSKTGKKKSNAGKIYGLEGDEDEDDSSVISKESGEEESSATDAHDDEEEEEKELKYRPNAAALAKQIRNQSSRTSLNSKRTTSTGKPEAYKPPRITPTSMPSTRRHRDHSPSDGNKQGGRRRKANLVDEYINEELSNAPIAQPSVGSNGTILDQGRRSGISTRDREKQRERLAYEENNFVRLPTESKAERRRAKARGERERRDMFGGEDWTGLGGLGDRINKSVSSTGNKNSVLERRTKRKRDTIDSPRGDGVGAGIGDAFQRRRQIFQDRAERKKRRRQD